MAMAMNHKIIAAEFELPEEIIQHIQSYMSGRDAARTTLLSKSWHRAWLTRPNLDFDLIYFGNRMDEFGEFTTKTMQRYEDRNQKIQSLKLRVNRRKRDLSLDAELIRKAIKLGVSDLEIQISIARPSRFVLPDEVLQSKTLTRLSVSSCVVDLERRRRRNKKITTFSNLKSLNLREARLGGVRTIRDLVSRCPLIEEFTLAGCIQKPPLFDVAELIKLHKLKYLRLERLDIADSLFEPDLWAKFACLKELVIWAFYLDDHEHRDLRICSTSLERIRISSLSYRDVNMEFDVPNIKMFEFQGEHLPRLEASSREWEADVKIMCVLTSKVSASWFSSLNQLAKMLAQSRVSLSISLCHSQGDGDAYVGDGLGIPTVENLTITGYYGMSPGFLNALLWSCRPNFVKILKGRVFGTRREEVKMFPKLSSLPWETLLDDSRVGGEYLVSFQLE